jgi:predicted peptidase
MLHRKAAGRQNSLAHLLLSFCSIAVCTHAFPASAAEKPTGILFRSATVGNTEYRYEVYVPSDWTPREHWPVILFLHGIGHRGTYPSGKTESVLARLFLAYQKPPRAVIVFPRCPEDATWMDARMEELAFKALDQSIHEFRGDPNRVYLTGLSMGGYGTWYLASRHPQRFAAIMPVCGGIRASKTVPLPPVSSAPDPYADVARKIGRMPVWVFHGAADKVIDVSESRKMVAALKAAGGRVRYTEYPGVGHNSWDKAYADSRLFPWLLSKRIADPQQ